MPLHPSASPWHPPSSSFNRANGDRRAYDSTAAILARHGVASLRLDLRGHGESTNRGRFVPFASGMDTLLQGTAADITAGLHWLARRPGIDPARLGVVGASYSGEFAIIAAQSGTTARSYAFLARVPFQRKHSVAGCS